MKRSIFLLDMFFSKGLLFMTTFDKYVKFMIDIIFGIFSSIFFETGRLVFILCALISMAMFLLCNKVLLCSHCMVMTLLFAQQLSILVRFF